MRYTISGDNMPVAICELDDDSLQSRSAGSGQSRAACAVSKRARETSTSAMRRASCAGISTGSAAMLAGTLLIALVLLSIHNHV